MKRSSRSKPRAFTLIELTIAIMLGMATGTIMIGLFNQQLTFLRIYNAQSFIVEEAPMVSAHVSRMIGKADRFRLHANLADATANAAATIAPSQILVLNYKQPDGSTQASILAFEGGRLNYYLVPAVGALGAPQWSITNRATNVSFALVAGVLQMTLTGPAGEVITYSGTMQS